MRRLPMLAACAALALSACGSPMIVRDRPVTVQVPVVQPCAAERPAAPVPLKDRTPDWDNLDARQKAAHVATQALQWQTYGQQLAAATGACP